MSNLKPVPTKEKSDSQEYRIYRPMKDNKGAATKWNIRIKQEKYRDAMVFVEGANQTGVDENGNASFSWKEKVVKMKLESNDLAAILLTLQGKNKECKLFHKNKVGNTTMNINPNEKSPGSFYFKISSQINGKLSSVQHTIGPVEAEILIVLLKDGISRIYNW